MRWLLWWRPPCLLRTVIVNFTHDGTMAVKGALWSSRGSWLVLRDAAQLLKDADGTVTAAERMVGEVVVHREHVSFLQVLP